VSFPTGASKKQASVRAESLATDLVTYNSSLKLIRLTIPSTAAANRRRTVVPLKASLGLWADDGRFGMPLAASAPERFYDGRDVDRLPFKKVHASWVRRNPSPVT